MLTERGIEQVDFIEMGAKGGELAVLEGGRRLQMARRPAILVEVEDV